jgi:hypothetical protein
MNAPESFHFEARCSNCRRLLGEVELPREHRDCPVIYTTMCRTSGCRGRKIPIRFDQHITATARAQGY